MTVIGFSKWKKSALIAFVASHPNHVWPDRKGLAKWRKDELVRAAYELEDMEAQMERNLEREFFSTIPNQRN